VGGGGWGRGRGGEGRAGGGEGGGRGGRPRHSHGTRGRPARAQCAPAAEPSLPLQAAPPLLLNPNPAPLHPTQGYPGDKKNTNGKLRLLYECAPMSMIAEQAGGLGSTGTERVMEVVPTKVHQRVPLFVGSKKEVEYLESFLKK
jgi:hypothetical protein